MTYIFIINNAKILQRDYIQVSVQYIQLQINCVSYKVNSHLFPSAFKQSNIQYRTMSYQIHYIICFLFAEVKNKSLTTLIPTCIVSV